MLVALRCIDVRDKALSMAFNMVFISLFAMLPAPIVYGAIIDNTCILWQEECGETSNCLLYDMDDFRKAVLLTTSFIILLGVIFDVGAWYYSKGLSIFNPEQKLNKAMVEEEGREEEAQVAEVENEEEPGMLERAVSAFSLNKESAVNGLR